jgi:hypothetical protein
MSHLRSAIPDCPPAPGTRGYSHDHRCDGRPRSCRCTPPRRAGCRRRFHSASATLLVVLVRLILGVDCRQALQVTGDSRQVVIRHVLHAVDYNVAHAAKHRAAITAAGFQELHQLLFAPTAQAILVVTAQAFGDPAFQRRTARQEGEPSDALRAFSCMVRARGVWQAPQWPRPSTRYAPRLSTGSWPVRPGVSRPRRAQTSSATCQRPAHAHRATECRSLFGVLDRRHAFHEVGIQRAHVMPLSPEA